jgi:membrane protease YdiL (CAAX protease family)
MKKHRPAAAPVDLAVITVICFGLFIFSSIEAVLAGFPDYRITDAQLGTLIAIEIAASVLALGYLRFRGHEIRGLVPAATLPGIVVGGGLYLLTLLLALPLESLLAQVLPELHNTSGALQPTAASPAMIVSVSLVNGLYEEAFLLGFLQAGMARSDGHFSVGAVLLVRLSYHLYQGPAGVLFVATFGAVVGYYYLKTGKLWPAVVAHMTGDVVGLSLG